MKFVIGKLWSAGKSDVVADSLCLFDVQHMADNDFLRLIEEYIISLNPPPPPPPPSDSNP